MKLSAGILAYHTHPDLEVFLVHPGGPFFEKKDHGAWSIPKGEYTDEDPLKIAIREFMEETGNILSETIPFIALGEVRLKSGKKISAWAIECDWEMGFISSNSFELEWPPKSGKKKLFPEVDKAGWFTLEQARLKLNPAQADFLGQLETILKNRS